MKICVVGSLNVDLTVEVNQFPQKGETIRAKSFNSYFGGKGGNQAVAARKLGLDVCILGSVGNDKYGQDYLKYMNELNINTDLVKINDTHTGLAMIEVEDSGENKIITVGGSNYLLDISWINGNLKRILENDIFLFSLEIPKDVVLHLLKIIKAEKKIVILDPAPADNYSSEMLIYVDYITPNETEFLKVCDKDSTSMEHLENASECFLLNTLILKSGKRGAYYIHNSIVKHYDGFNVKAIDSVAAGDSFNAGFGYAIANNYTQERALMFANAVGALSTTKKGAQSGMPTLEEVNDFLRMNRLI